MAHVRRKGVRYPADVDPLKSPWWRMDIKKENKMYIWNAWNQSRMKKGLVRVDPPLRFYDTTFRPRIDKKTGVRPSSESISYGEFISRNRGQSGPLIDAFNKTPPVTPPIAHAMSSSEESIDESGSTLTDQDPVLEPPPTEDVPMASTSGEPAPKRVRQDLEISETHSGYEKTTSSDGGFDSAQGPMSVLPTGGYSTNGGSMTLTKVHRMKSWAIPYWNITDATTRGGSNLVTTPLMKIPWDRFAFYGSPEEFALIPAGSYVKDVSIQVYQIVAQTSFTTGGASSTVAVTNHPKILCVGKDLEAKCRGGVDRLLTLTSDMIPSITSNATVKDFMKDFVAKQYGTDQTAVDTAVVVPGAAHKIPFYNKCHFCIYQPTLAQAQARGITADHAMGFEYFQNMISESNANDTAWAPIDSMHYTFSKAPIGDRYKPFEILTSSVDQAVGSASYYNMKRNIAGINANVAITESMVDSDFTRAGTHLVTYKSAPMEKGAYITTGDAAGTPARQPSYHIGMRAVDKLGPETDDSRATAFVNASIEFEIRATINITCPSYPNRFTRPKYYNTSVENVAGAISNWPGYIDPIITFGLPDESAIAPAVSAVDAGPSDVTEDDARVPRRSRRTHREITFEKPAKPASRART